MLVAMQDVSARYGHPVVVLNLVKSAEKRPRETILRKEFAIAIAYINQQVPPQYLLKMVAYSSAVVNPAVLCCAVLCCAVWTRIFKMYRVVHRRLPCLHP